MLPESNILLRNEMFSAAVVPAPVDLIVCRQVVEHVVDPRALIADMAEAVTPNGYIYLEVPSVDYILEN